MNYFKLAYTTPDVLEKIKEAEERGDYNSHIDTIDYSNCIPVDENFPYIPTGMLKFRQALIRTFIIAPFMWIVNRFIFHTRIYKNSEIKYDNHSIIKNNDMTEQLQTEISKNIIIRLKKHKNIITQLFTDRYKNRNIINQSFIDRCKNIYTIKNIFKIDNFQKIKQDSSHSGMIITCNHINKLDALVVKWALKKSGMLCGRHLKVFVAGFNNQKGRLGEYMRAFGIMPFPSGHRLVRLFDSAVSYYLERGDCILIFPEQSEWWGYDRPRPLKNGAFYYAVKNNVPVQPLFITCRGATGTCGNRGEKGLHFCHGVFNFGNRTAGSKIGKRYFDVHILDRIEPVRNDVNEHEKIRIMKEKNSIMWQEVYLLKK